LSLFQNDNENDNRYHEHYEVSNGESNNHFQQQNSKKNQLTECLVNTIDNKNLSFLIFQIVLPPNIESKAITFMFSVLFSSVVIVVVDGSDDEGVESAGVGKLGFVSDGAEDWEGTVDVVVVVVVEVESDGVEIVGEVDGDELDNGGRSISKISTTSE
jgi:hypothetical protein